MNTNDSGLPGLPFQPKRLGSKPARLLDDLFVDSDSGESLARVDIHGAIRSDTGTKIGHVGTGGLITDRSLRPTGILRPQGGVTPLPPPKL